MVKFMDLDLHFGTQRRSSKLLCTCDQPPPCCIVTSLFTSCLTSYSDTTSGELSEGKLTVKVNVCVYLLTSPVFFCTFTVMMFSITCFGAAPFTCSSSPFSIRHHSPPTPSPSDNTALPEETHLIVIYCIYVRLFGR